MGASIRETTFLGQEAVRISNNQVSLVVVPAWGSNVISLLHEPTGMELLRVPDSEQAFWRAPVLYGIPVLFPPNRIADGRFAYRGRSYQFDINEPERGNHIHGFVHTRPWEVVRSELDAAGRAMVETRFDVHKIPDSGEVLRQFPHHFVLTMRFVLDGATLLKEAQVYNVGTEPFPFGLGFHTTFALPTGEARFALDVEKRWRLNDRMVPTGQLEDFPFRHQMARGMNLAGVTLDDPFFVGNKTGGSAATLTYWAGAQHLSIRYEVDGHFRHWVVYNADGKSGFVCSEPYTWITNAPNLDLPASLTGLQELWPGQRRQFATSITISAGD